MALFTFSTLIISVIFLLILGSWYSIQGPFLLHLVMVVATAVAIFSAAILTLTQPLYSSRSRRAAHANSQEGTWGREFSSALSTPAAILDGYMVKFVNTPFLQTLGMAGMTDQVVGMPFTNLIHPADHQNLAELTAQANMGKTKTDPTKIRLLCADGSTLPCHASLTRMREDNQNNLLLFQFIPISTISPLSNDFETQFNYHSIIDRLEEIVFQLDAEGKIIFLNTAWQNMLEYQVKDSLKKSVIDFFHPEDKPMLEARINSLTQGKRTHCTIEARLISIRGDSNWISMRAKTTSTAAGERTSVIGTMTDIQRTKEAETSQLANRRALNTLLNNIPGMVYRGRYDRSWTFEYVSDGCIDVTGYNPLDLINEPNLTFNLIIHPDDRAAVWESVKQQLSSGEDFQLIYRIITRKGETKLVQEYGRGILSSTGELLALEGFITGIPDPRYNVLSFYKQEENSV